MSLIFQCPHLDDTEAVAERVARMAARGDVITLQGDLGAGKTAFARAFIRSLVGRAIDVPSPTFTLVQVYETTVGDVWHFDLYRLEATDDVWELGLEEALAEGITLIEWPERLGEMRLPRHLHVSFGGVGDARTIALSPDSSWEPRL